jgi:Predicted hydrolases or acyltransferases (alpha/beta hydrolase superfamily)
LPDNYRTPACERRLGFLNLKCDQAVAHGEQAVRINRSGVRIHYLLGGDPTGTPVLLWHGFLSTSQEWRKVMPRLAGSGYAVLVPDMRGYGDSDKPAGTAGW